MRPTSRVCDSVEAEGVAKEIGDVWQGVRLAITRVVIFEFTFGDFAH